MFVKIQPFRVGSRCPAIRSIMSFYSKQDGPLSKEEGFDNSDPWRKSSDFSSYGEYTVREQEGDRERLGG
jgi:hypothetical protein